MSGKTGNGGASRRRRRAGGKATGAGRGPGGKATGASRGPGGKATGGGRGPGGKATGASRGPGGKAPASDVGNPPPPGADAKTSQGRRRRGRRGAAGDRVTRAGGDVGHAETSPRERAPEPEHVTRYVGDDVELRDVEEQIRALEARLDGMIRKASVDADEEPPSIREQVSYAAREVVDRLAMPLERPGSEDGGMVDIFRELFSSDYYLRQWGRIGMRHRSEEVDDFGLDPVYERKVRPLADFLYKQYFRVAVEGIENLPGHGRCLVVANHSGTLPLDGPMLRTAVRLEHPTGRELRWLAEDFIYYLPFVGAFMSRVGAVRACQENAERLLQKDSLVAVFPEGVKGIGKLYRDRYKLQRFGRGGFIRLCLRTRTPLVPCAVIGAEEANPLLYRNELLGRAVGLPYMPVTPTFPWLGLAGLLPAPTKWRMVFGEVMTFDEYGPEAAEDHVLVGRLADRVRGSIQQALDQALQDRRSVWLG